MNLLQRFLSHPGFNPNTIASLDVDATSPAVEALLLNWGGEICKSRDGPEGSAANDHPVESGSCGFHRLFR